MHVTTADPAGQLTRPRSATPTVAPARLHHLIEAQADRTPDAVAIVADGAELDFASLDRLANGVARALRSLGVESEALVGLFVERSPDMAVGTLGILKAGAAYVPADPSYPSERIGLTFRDAGVGAIVTRRHLLDRLPDPDVPVVCLEDVQPASRLSGEGAAGPSLAYVIYTSGSTGRPKGVMVDHANLLHYVRAMGEALGIGPADRWLHTASIAFSSSVRQLFVPLSQGASVAIATRRETGDPRSLMEFAARHRATVVDLVPSAWQSCLAALEGLGAGERATLLDNDIRLALSASEPLPHDVPRRWRELRHAALFVNMYGQTETAGIASIHPVPRAPDERATRVVPIGRPIAGLRLFVLDEAGVPVAPGEAGELCICGPTVGRGYLGRPELTAERFVASFAADHGGRMYRTGDRAKLLADGTVEYLGRLDNQVKIRGHRVELEEVEGALRRHAAVREAVVVARDANGETRLDAYLVLPARPLPTVEELRAFLAERLPAYMIPAGYLPVAALPRTPNGKVDRAALGSVTAAPLELGSSFVAPSGEIECAVAAIWTEVLGLERVGAEDNFFTLGGHSLTGVRVAARIRDRFGVELPLRALFERPTVAGLAERIERERLSQPSVERRPLVRSERSGESEPSFAQQRLWLLHQLDPRSAAYNLCAAIHMRGRLDERALARALTEVARRHESLRTVFPASDGAPRQVVQPASPVELPLVDLRDHPADGRRAESERLAAEEVRRPFDLARGPLFRCLLIRLSPDEHLLVLTMHHIVSDGWSRGVLYREVGALYDAFARGARPALPEPVVQYADYAEWQRGWLTEPVVESQLAYWRRQLGGTLPTLSLPTDRARPAVQTFNGATHRFVVPRPLAEALRALGLRDDATVFMVLLAAFQVLLGRYAGQDDVIVGTPVAGRARPEVEGLIGFFVNTLALRGDLSGDPTFRELLVRAREAALEAFANQDVPFERVVETLHLDRDLSRSPLFQVLFILQSTPVQPLRLGALELMQLELDVGAAKLDLSLSLVARDDGYVGHLEYNTDLFDAETIERLAGHYLALLAEVAADPDRPISLLPILTERERQRVLVEWNDTAREIPVGRCVHELIAAQAAATPDATAACFENDRLTFREMESRANRLAHHLRALGVGPDVPVGLAVERSLEMLVGMLAILKAGGAYVPLDPAYPRERIAYMLEDSQAPVLLTRRRIADRVPTGGTRTVYLDDDEWTSTPAAPVAAPASGVSPANLAYVIYTSGSTGRPKGVMIEHRNVVNFFAGMDERIGGDGPGVWLAVTSISFDISVLELLWTLARGFTVVIQGDAERPHPVSPAVPARVARAMDFSLFYFASNAEDGGSDKYRLLLDGARFADRHGFRAVWTPERHFHAFGGLYPNPSVTGAAVAAVTERVEIRAGSVVLPLHSPIRVAEEWSVVDNISHGRVGLAFASGWHDRDFVFAPDNYARRRELTFELIEQVRALWRGESIPAKTGAGKETRIGILPRPVQPELPVWVTAAGTPETYESAGRIGANILTHLLGQSVEQLAQKVALYRESWRRHGHAGEGRVSLMMHTFLGADVEAVREMVRGPFREYLRTSVDLISKLAEGRGQDLRSSSFTAEDMEALLDHAFDRYFGTSALLGTPDGCLELVTRLGQIGIDEVACLIDFGVAQDAVMESLDHLARLKERVQAAAAEPAREDADYSIAAQIERYGVTHLQCTPSMAGMLLQQPETTAALGRLRTLMIGGEAFPPALAAALRAHTSAAVVNMYGPTETTIWSSTHAVEAGDSSIPIGRPIANTTFYVLDARRQPVPPGVAGELYIGGAGVVRGYLRRPELTAERFVPDPFGSDGRLYRTGDLVRFRSDGNIDFLGRIDQQVKLRGFRIELGEIEAALRAQPSVRESVVVVREDAPGDRRLVGYVVPRDGAGLDIRALRDALRASLPEYMVPSHLIELAALPLTPNAKVDRKALPAPEAVASRAAPALVEPASALEQALTAVWSDVLRSPAVGVEDNFFDIGGHSLLVVKVHARLRADLGRTIAITDLFRFPTIRSLARHLGGSEQPALPAPVEERADSRRQALARRRDRRQQGPSTQLPEARQ